MVDWCNGWLQQLSMQRLVQWLMVDAMVDWSNGWLMQLLVPMVDAVVDAMVDATVD